MKRDLSQKLDQWKSQSQRKPLILHGARQVGKTYLLREFGQRSYADVAYFNFDEDRGLSQFFGDQIDPSEILQKLSLYRQKKIEPKNTLLILDEIQESPRALASLKYFYEQTPEMHIAAAGSLLGVKLGEGEGFPVGKVNFLSLYPLSFFEFLSATGQSGFRELLENLTQIEPLSEPFHTKLINWVRIYLYTGGMPEAVQTYVKTENFDQVRQVQKEILTAYEHDFSKHAGASEAIKILRSWRSIPAHLAKENKKYMFSAIEKSARAREYEIALHWLKNAGLIHLCHKVKKPSLPLASYTDSNAFKVYLLDVGLLAAMSELSSRTVVDGDRLFQEFKGALIENFVAQESVATSSQELQYWSSSAMAEVDFIFESDGKIYPVEVKSGLTHHKRSLLEYDKKYAPPILVRISPQNLKRDGRVLNCPLYLTARLKNGLIAPSHP